MKITSNTQGIQNLRLRIEQTKILLPGLLADTAQLTGDTMAEDLGNAAPQGKGEGGENPPGDAPGPLSESFSAYAEIHANGNSAVADVTTDQPLKFKFVTEGRGEVLPKTKKALFWKGLDHPVRRAGPAAANDFVSPVLDKVEEVVGPEMDDLVNVLDDILGGA